MDAQSDLAHLIRSRLLDQARDLTDDPGCYLMKDEAGGILYVGKAKKLKNRVTTYFKQTSHDSPRVQLLVQKIRAFDVILTSTESEALLLECSLIKKHKPPFNILLKDDKMYPYIRMSVQDRYPRLEIVRKVERNGSRYFGPFPSGWSARQSVRLLTEGLRLRDCSENTFRHRTRPCLLFQMGRCSAPCVGEVSEEQYRAQVEEAVRVLEGKGGGVLDQLRVQMQSASESEDFERAAEIRDQLASIEVVTETQSVIQADREQSYDVVGMARSKTDATLSTHSAHGCVLQVRLGRLIAVKHFTLNAVDLYVSDEQLLENLLAQYYVREHDQNHNFEILVPLLPADCSWLESSLGVRFQMPVGVDQKRLIEVARLNARHAFENESRKSGQGEGMGAVEDVYRRLKLEKLPFRIECYDVSHLQGTDAVASRVVFIHGAPEKNLYRKYKIRTVEGNNDFAAMKEVLSRRFQRTDDPFPDLVVVDGGKGQLAQAVAILAELNVQGVEAVGLAKARTQSDFQAAEVKTTAERIYKPNRVNPVPLLPHTRAYRLLVQVRDEAHRFAVSYHRQARGKRALSGGDP